MAFQAQATTVTITVLAMALAGAPVQAQSPEVSAKERRALLNRAQLWHRVDVSRVNIRVGPTDGAFAPGETITCDYVDKKFGGRTPKFACARKSSTGDSTVKDHGDNGKVRRDILKVRYGRDNGEIYAGVAATRLLWALGFGADGLYPVRVLCVGCPDALAKEGTPSKQGVLFDVAAVERPFAGADVEASDGDTGWSWDELDVVDQNAGGAPLVQRDALRLLAAFLQHGDNKPEQQRLVCRTEGDTRKALADCPDPFLMIHDLGVTFGRANLLNNGRIGSSNLETWSTTPIWKSDTGCVANLPASQSGTLDDPVISDGGRLFLLRLLASLTDRQLTDLFTVARFDSKPSGGGPIKAWVTAFKQKRREIAERRCQS